MSSAAELPHRLLVLAPGTDQSVHYVSRHVAARMLEKKQARREGRNVLRLLHLADIPAHECRTFVARGGPLAAMGMSQVYTRSNVRGEVTGFKQIFAEDRPFFHQATAPCVGFS